MKKLIVGGAVAAALILAVCPAKATVGMLWYDDSEPYVNTVSGGGAFTLGKTVLTYFSNDTTVNHTGIPFQNSYADDVFFQATATTVEAGYYDTSPIFTLDDSKAGKYVYAVVLDLPYASFTDLASIPGGTKWGVSAMGYSEGGPNPTPLAVMGTNPPQSLIGGPVNLIPEPGSAALVLFGAAAAYWRRRQNRR